MIIQPWGGILLLESQLSVLPGWRKYTETVDNYPGEYCFGGVQDMRDLSLSVYVSTTAKDAYIRDLAKWLNPNDGYQEFILDTDDDKYLLVKCEQGLGYVDGPGCLSFVVPLTAKPFYYSVETFWLWGAGTIVCDGNVDTPCVITWYDACTNPSVAINGVAITYTGVLIDGDYVVIDIENMTATKNGTTNVLGNMTANWPQLEPGDNIIATSNFVSIQYQDRWV